MGHEWTAGDALTSDRLNRTKMFGGDGSDGALDTTSAPVAINLGSAEYVEKNYSSIDIVTNNLTFTNPAPKGTVVVLKCQGDFVCSASIIADHGADGGAGGAGGASNSADGVNGTDSTDSDEILDTVAHYGAGGEKGITDNGGGAFASAAAAYTQTGAGNLYTLETDDLYRKLFYIVPGAGGAGGGGASAGEGASFGVVIFQGLVDPAIAID